MHALVSMCVSIQLLFGFRGWRIHWVQYKRGTAGGRIDFVARRTREFAAPDILHFILSFHLSAMRTYEPSKICLVGSGLFIQAYWSKARVFVVSVKSDHSLWSLDGDCMRKWNSRAFECSVTQEFRSKINAKNNFHLSEALIPIQWFSRSCSEFFLLKSAWSH